MAETNPTASASKPQRASPRPAVASIGEVFGRLTVQSVFMGKNGARASCVCSCGVMKSDIRLNTLRTGQQLSCGCLTKENHPKTHGMSRSSEYSSWAHMKGRCGNKNNHKYADYGGRGIYVCGEWGRSFAAFFAFVGPKPTPDHEIDRYPDNDGPYAPGNVRWATRGEQLRNTRRTRSITFRGETKVVMDWSAATGLHDNTIYSRLDAGIAPDIAITAPPGMRYRLLEMNGESRNIAEWSRIVGLDKKTIDYRLKHGMSVTAALTTPRRGGRRPRKR